jgi:uncharacterized protein (DUF885 family)
MRTARLLLAAGLLCSSIAALAAGAEATQRLEVLFERYWEQTASLYPEWATWSGDLHRFHNAVLDQVALPLPVLNRVIDGWIAAEASR